MHLDRLPISSFPAIAQLEERRFVIGNQLRSTLGPVFESRWLDFFALRSVWWYIYELTCVEGR